LAGGIFGEEYVEKKIMMKNVVASAAKIRAKAKAGTLAAASGVSQNSLSGRKCADPPRQRVEQA